MTAPPTLPPMPPTLLPLTMCARPGCGRQFTPRSVATLGGSPQRYCSPECRKHDWDARQRRPRGGDAVTAAPSETAGPPDGAEVNGEAWADMKARAERAEEQLAALRAALETISRGEGRFSVDHLTHAENTIEDMRRTAVEALAALETP